MNLLHTIIKKKQLAAKLNVLPPEGAMKFEGTDTYVKFETGEYVIFEETNTVPEGALQFEGTEVYATFDNGEFITFE